MTGERIAQAQKLHDEGKTYQVIADIMDVSYMVIYAALNPLYAEEKRLCAARYYKNHQEEVREYRKTHRVEIRLCDAKYRKKRKAEKRLYNTEYWKAHKKYYRKYHEKYYEAHKEKYRLYAAEYGKTHKAECTARVAARKALIAEVTMGNLDEIKEIYRIAAEESKVRCYLCGRLIPKGHRHVDHIFPVSKGGAHRPSNLAVTCDECNEKKHDKLPEEIGLLF